MTQESMWLLLYTSIFLATGIDIGDPDSVGLENDVAESHALKTSGTDRAQRHGCFEQRNHEHTFRNPYKVKRVVMAEPGGNLTDPTLTSLVLAA